MSASRPVTLPPTSPEPTSSTGHAQVQSPAQPQAQPQAHALSSSPILNGSPLNGSSSPLNLSPDSSPERITRNPLQLSPGQQQPVAGLSPTSNGHAITRNTSHEEGAILEDAQHANGDSSPMELVDDEMGGGFELEGSDEFLPEDYMQDLRRVKVYELVGQNWKDLGTAFCSGEYDEQAHEAQLVAKAEDTQEILLQISVRNEDVYQRQADTLIVWTEVNGKDYALSFQDVEGCSEVWEFISEVRRHLRVSRDEPSSSPFPDHAGPASLQNATLPVPTLANLGEIEGMVRASMGPRSAASKERFAEQIVGMEFIRKLKELMSDAEDLQSVEDLHALCTLTQAILVMNDQSIYEHVLRDDVFSDMVGLLEYDPEFPHLKANYRDFLRENAKHHQVVDFRDPIIRMKVHHTYRLQYLKDVVLSRVLDDPTFNVLNSLIIFNQIDIVTHIQNEEYFLREIFSYFPQHPSSRFHPANAGYLSAPAHMTEEQRQEEEAKEEVKRAPALLLLHQFCSMGKNVQLPMRLPLFRSLVDRGILYPVQWALCQSDIKVVNTAGEILSMVLDHDAGGVRGHILRQVEEEAKKDAMRKATNGSGSASTSASTSNGPAEQASRAASSSGSVSGPTVPEPAPLTLLSLMTEMLTNTEYEMSLKSQLAESYKTLMDVPGTDNLPGLKMMQPSPRKEDQQSERFLDYFYKHCAGPLFRPLMENVPTHKNITSFPLKLSRAESDLYLYLCDLLCGFMLQHSFQSHWFVLSNNLAPRLASLLYAREKHLRLASLRFFRTCLRLNNRNFFLHMEKEQVFAPILDLTRRESNRDNLLSSCCQEFFEHLRRENFKDVIDHIMKEFDPQVRKLATSPVVGLRFISLIRKWEANNEPPPKVEIKPPQAQMPKRWGGTRVVDAEDEWFNADEEEGPTPNTAGVSPPGAAGAGAGAAAPTGRTTRARRRGAATPVVNTGPNKRSQRPANVALPRAYPIGAALVDYQEEDESGEASASASTSAAEAGVKPELTDSAPTPNVGAGAGANANAKARGQPQEGTRLRGRGRRPELTRTASHQTLDLNGVPSGVGPVERPGTPIGPHPTDVGGILGGPSIGVGVGAGPGPSNTGDATGAGSAAPGHIRRSPSTDIGLVAMDEDDDLMNPPVPLSHKRRRDSEDDDETLERLAKRPALTGASGGASTAAGAGSDKGKEVDKGGATTAQGTTTTPTAAAAAGSGPASSNTTSSPEPTRSSKRQLRVKLGSGTLAQGQGQQQQQPQQPPQDVKVGDKG